MSLAVADKQQLLGKKIIAANFEQSRNNVTMPWPRARGSGARWQTWKIQPPGVLQN